MDNHFIKKILYLKLYLNLGELITINLNKNLFKYKCPTTIYLFFSIEKFKI